MTSEQKWTPPSRIRVIAIGLVIEQNHLLVFEGYDAKRQSPYYRPLGGEIEFGETGEQALKREFLEEINQPIEQLEYLETLENHYQLEDVQGHELVRVYRVSLVNSEAYNQDYVITEPGQLPLQTRWLDLTQLAQTPEQLVPKGLWQLLKI